MNTNPSAVKLLCYGDSNTWGQKPDKTGRYEANVRWTGVLQNLLGEQYYVIEEGLNSRTTDLEYDRKPGRNGKTYLIPCVVSHTPVDIVAIMLGTNDLKVEFRRSAAEIADALAGLIDDVRSYAATRNGDKPKIILISPIEIDAHASRFAEFYTGYYNTGSMVKSKQLAKEIKKVAAEKSVFFLDAATVARPGEDGIHLSEESERPLAELVAGMARSVS